MEPTVMAMVVTAANARMLTGVWEFITMKMFSLWREKERKREMKVCVCVCRPETMPQPAAHQIMIIVHV